ncbi:MAG TPA: extracellular solute-binding protein [Casimicrobiaceae bacterium]|nr:extracellular solute-binding protein [Casimicrobiaceae bacterium]
MEHPDQHAAQFWQSRISRRTFLQGATAAVGSAAMGSWPASAAAPVEILVLHVWGTPPGQAAASTMHPIAQLIEAFNARNPGIIVRGETPSTDYFATLQKAQAQIAAGRAPALVTTPWSNINFAVQGLQVASLEQIGGNEVGPVLANYKDEVLPLVTMNRQTVGLPLAFSCPVMYYNNDIMKQAGVDPAELFKDWASFKRLGPKVKAITGNPILGLGNNADWEAQSIIQCNGGRVLDDNFKPAWDSPAAVAAMATIADINKAGLYLQSTTTESNAAFIGGSLAIWMGSIASLGGLSKQVKFDLKTSPFPVFPGKPRRMSSGGSFLGCYARDKEQQRAAWEFLKFVGSKEGMEIWLKTGYLNSTKFEHPVLPGQESAYIQLREGLTRESPWPGARAAQIQKVWGTYVERIWAGDISAEEGCKQAKQQAEPLLPKA